MEHEQSYDPNKRLDSISKEMVEDNEIYGNAESFLSLLRKCQHNIAPLVYALSKSDYLIFCLYVRSDVTQSQIALMMGRSQASISKRFRGLKEKLKILLSMPSRNIIEVHQDMEHIFEDQYDMIEIALVSYFEFGGVMRIKNYIEASSAGMIKKQKRMMRYLEKRAGEDYLANKYFEHFTNLYKSSGAVSFYDNSNMKERGDSIVKGVSVLGVS